MKYLSSMAALLFAVVPNLQAGEMPSEPVPAAYINVPFGGDAKAAPSYGLQVARLESDAQQSSMLFDPTQRAYLDIRFSGGDMSSLSLNGTDFVALAKQHGYNANGDSSFQQWWSSLSPTEIALFAVAGIAAVGCAADWCQEDEEEEQKCPSGSGYGFIVFRKQAPLPDCGSDLREEME
jgi:hypothetical protein